MPDNRTQTLEAPTPVNPARGDSVTIVWHLGFIKTGTTAIQQMLRKGRHLMPPTVTAFRRQDEAVHVRVACRKWRQKPTKEKRAAVVQAVQDVRDAAVESGVEFAIFSDENVVEFEAYSHRGDIFEAAQRTIPLLEEAAYPAKSVFVFYTRDFDKWLESAHNQTVKMLRLVDDFETYRANVPFEMNWDAQKAALQATVKSDVIFHDMAEDIDSDLPLGSGLMALCNIDCGFLEQLPESSRKNESLSPAALKFMLQINRSDLSNASVRKIRQMVMQNSEMFE
ncbi:MAG: sulfotransferase [Paracoccaceae bacterium]|nr:sulfotransferase [Paracoccaceae bacterium]MDG1738204.1 sulfotransferase [Paracoccaceae bacterium]MDG2260375.1 sulfotransferase [Paracoccaceae bacterium]